MNVLEFSSAARRILKGAVVTDFRKTADNSFEMIFSGGEDEPCFRLIVKMDHGYERSNQSLAEIDKLEDC